MRASGTSYATVLSTSLMGVVCTPYGYATRGSFRRRTVVAYARNPVLPFRDGFINVEA